MKPEDRLWHKHATYRDGAALAPGRAYALKAVISQTPDNVLPERYATGENAAPQPAYVSVYVTDASCAPPRVRVLPSERVVSAKDGESQGPFFAVAGARGFCAEHVA